jgi:hypothetical protein
MIQIESAAREICEGFDLFGYREVDFDPVLDIAETIRRHLFPVVTDPQKGKIYWVKAGNRFYLSNGEIPTIGPIPEPE